MAKIIYSPSVFFLLVACFLLVPLRAVCQSQTSSPLSFGVKAGAGFSLNPNMDNILVSEDYYSNYTFESKGKMVPTAALFAQYHRAGDIFGVEGAIAYWQKATELHYHDINELDYAVNVRYHHLGVAAYVKVYPWRHGFSVQAGGRVGANLSAEGLAYTSNQEDDRFASHHYDTAAETEALMKEKLKGRPDAAIGGGFGYEFPFGLTLDLRYHYGLLNTVKTETNTYRWVEATNHCHNVELSVGWKFSVKN